MGLGRRFGILFSALFIAVLLWSYVHLSKPYETDVDLPFRIAPPKGLAVSSSVPERLHARVRGAGWQILLMDFAKNSFFELDLADRDVRELSQTSLIIHNDDLLHSAVLPTDVSLLKVEPDSLEMQFAAPIQKRVVIEPRVSVTPAFGFLVVGKPIVTPSQVLLQGSHQVLDSLLQYPTIDIIERGVREPITRTVELSDTLRNILSLLSTEKVTVRINVEAIGEKIFKDVPLQVEAVPPDKEVLIVPGTVSVALRGGVNELAKLKPSEIHARIVYDAMKFDTARTVTPVIDAPQGVQYLSHQPEQFQFVVRKRFIPDASKSQGSKPDSVNPEGVKSNPTNPETLTPKK